MGLFDIGGKVKPRNVAGVKNSRFIEPHDCEEIAKWRVKYANAEKLAEDIGDMPEGFRAFVILDGKFILGDLIEALIVRNGWKVENLTISTLSMSRENVDSFKNLVEWGLLDELNITVSDWFFASERRGLVPYIYKELDHGDKFQLAVASSHMKIAQIRTTCGRKITIHGSGNLRSSGSVEQIMIETSAEIYDFALSTQQAILDLYATINKRSPRAEVWEAILAAGDEGKEVDRKSKVGV